MMVRGISRQVYGLQLLELALEHIPTSPIFPGMVQLLPGRYNAAGLKNNKSRLGRFNLKGVSQNPDFWRCPEVGQA